MQYIYLFINSQFLSKRKIDHMLQVSKHETFLKVKMSFVSDQS